MFGNKAGSFSKKQLRETYEPVSGPQPCTAAEAKHNVGQNPKTYFQDRVGAGSLFGASH